MGFLDGGLELWNINSKKLIYNFSSHLRHLHRRAGFHHEVSASGPVVEVSGAINQANARLAAVSALEQSPACDVIGAGFVSGDILLINLKLDQVLFSFHQDGGAVTSLSFRTDSASEKLPYMVSASADGRLHVWNLGSTSSSEGQQGSDNGDGGGLGSSSALVRTLQCSVEDAHVGAVSRVAFLHGQPLMVSAGAQDNSLKVWIFDALDGSPRLLRSRCGHMGHPTRIRHYGGSTHVSMRDNADALSCELISVGVDGTVRLFNTAVESQNREMSQKPLLKKLGLFRRNERLSQCIGFDFSETRQRDWGNMVTIHQSDARAYVWRNRHRVATEMILKQPQWSTNDRKHSVERRHHAASVVVSSCGNFCVVGHAGGEIYKYVRNYNV